MNEEKTKRMQLLYVKKAHFSKMDPCGICGLW